MINKLRFGFDQRPSPAKCRCGAKLGQLMYGPVLGLDRYKLCYHVRCETCKSYTIWTHPGRFVREIPDSIAHVAAVWGKRS